MQIAYVAFVVCTVLFGLYLISWVYNKTALKKQRYFTVSLLPLSGHVEEAEYQVRSLLAKQKWQMSEPDHILILVDQGMDMQTRDICEKLGRDYQNVLLCDDCQVGNLVQQGLSLHTERH